MNIELDSCPNFAENTLPVHYCLSMHLNDHVLLLCGSYLQVVVSLFLLTGADLYRVSTIRLRAENP